MSFYSIDHVILHYCICHRNYNTRYLLVLTTTTTVMLNFLVNNMEFAFLTKQHVLYVHTKTTCMPRLYPPHIFKFAQTISIFKGYLWKINLHHFTHQSHSPTTLYQYTIQHTLQLNINQYARSL